jgi:hypothetical protein
MLLPAAKMPTTRTDLYHGLFRWHTGSDGHACVSKRDAGPSDLRMAYACPECLELVWLVGA